MGDITKITLCIPLCAQWHGEAPLVGHKEIFWRKADRDWLEQNNLIWYLCITPGSFFRSMNSRKALRS